MYPGHPDYNGMDDHIVHFAVKEKINSWPYEIRRSLCGNNDMKIIDWTRDDHRLDVHVGMAQKSLCVDNVNCLGCLSELFLLKDGVKLD
jgi:hypothetical protein